MNNIVNIIRRIALKYLFQNVHAYNLALIFARFSNLILPHEEDLWGLKQLNFNNNDIIDVGASDGLCFKSIKYLGFSNNYIAFEAVKKNKKYLDKIKKKNINFKFYMLALGNKNNKSKIFTPVYKNIYINNWSSFSKKECIKNLKGRNFNIDYKKLNFFQTKTNQKKLDYFKLKPFFLKIDVEGYENKVLSGGLQTIKKYKPIIYVENQTNKFNSEIVKYFKKKLLRYGYAPYMFNYNKKKFFKFNSLNMSIRFFSYNIFFLRKIHFI